MTGNTYNTRKIEFTHARKVWREMREKYPAGGRVVNISDWVEAGKKCIPAGTLAKWSVNASGGKEATCYLPSALPTLDATKDSEGKDVAATADLSADYGYTDRDLPIIDGDTVGTITVIYEGEIYKYMLDEAVQPVGRALVPLVKQVM